MRQTESLYSVRLLAEQPIAAESDLIQLHARVNALGRRLGFDSLQCERVRLVAAEMATNQTKYAGGRGYIQVWEVGGDPCALDLFAMDWGSGISDLIAAQRDGHSSGGTLGKGLGAISRLSDCSDIFSLPADQPARSWQGTVVWARFGAGPPNPLWARTGLFMRAYQDGRCNGDLVALQRADHGVRVLHLDALGHGCPAEAVASRALSAFDTGVSANEAIQRIDRALSEESRGAALALYDLDFAAGTVRSIGAGDLQASILQGNGKQTVRLTPGVIGQVHGSLDITEWVWPYGAFFMSASDGLRASWDPLAAPGLLRRHPQLIAYFMGQMAGRISDDKSLLLVRNSIGHSIGQGGDHDIGTR
ncbi:MAG: SpoIIE family protein phosphatase [Acidiferrobacteraceae bacterium]